MDGLFNAAAHGIVIKIVADKGSTLPGPSYMPPLVREDLVDRCRLKSLADLRGLKETQAGLDFQQYSQDGRARLG